MYEDLNGTSSYVDIFLQSTQKAQKNAISIDFMQYPCSATHHNEDQSEYPF